MEVKTNKKRVVGCAPDNVIILMIYFALKIRGVDVSDMQNPIPQYNILNKDMCKNSKDYVCFSYQGIVLHYKL